MASTRADANLASVTAVLFRNIPDHGSVQCARDLRLPGGGLVVEGILPVLRAGC
jgi:hypothetical protein